jgi:hypothetical protein
MTTNVNNTPDKVLPGTIDVRFFLKETIILEDTDEYYVYDPNHYRTIDVWKVQYDERTYTVRFFSHESYRQSQYGESSTNCVTRFVERLLDWNDCPLTNDFTDELYELKEGSTWYCLTNDFSPFNGEPVIVPN